MIKHINQVVGYCLLSLCFFIANAQAAALPDFVEVAEQYGPSVVNISTTQMVSRNRLGIPHKNMPPLPEGFPFNELFRDWLGDNRGGQREYRSRSLGSGFIISKDGYILTNNHVIQGADEIVVRLSDRRELEAKLIGTDKRSDVALLKVDADNLPVVKIGQSSQLKVGEWVLAIGSPFDFDHTVTAGIVSALGRNLPSENYVPFIQTDVAINPGNSGGPLFNMDGEVVGVNAQIYSRTGGFMGLSFTIPIDLAMDVVDQLKNNGHVTRGWLGILIQDVTRELAESFGMDKPGGALVSQVLADSPAQAAGFEVGDVVVEFNGKEVANSGALPPMVGVTPVDQEVPVKVLRKGKFKMLSVDIGKLPSAKDQAIVVTESDSELDSRLKINIAELSDEERAALEITEGGVIVKSLESGPANDAGVVPGDVIVMINNTTVTGLDHFQALLAALPANKPVAVLIQRSSGPLFLAIRLSED